MKFECPSCHKHRFQSWRFAFLGFSRRENPVYCPHCGVGLTLDVKSENRINLVFGAAFFTYIGLCFVMASQIPAEWREFSMIVIGVGLTAGTRLLAVNRFGKIVSIKPRTEQSYPRIRLADVKAEVELLKKDGGFFVLYAPDESAYLSFGLQKDVVVADLAFAIGKFKDLEPAFRAAVTRAGATSRSYQRRGLHGVEAPLGNDSLSVASKIRTIMQETFGLKADAEVPLMRDGT